MIAFQPMNRLYIMGKISMKGRVPTLYLGPQRIFISEGCTQASPLTTDVKWLCVIIVPLRFGCVFLKTLMYCYFPYRLLSILLI